MIKPEGDEWVLYTHDGSKVLGRFKTEAEALKREREIQYFKHAGQVAGADVSIEAVIGHLTGETTTTVQTVIFKKAAEWTQEKAVAWLEKHGYHAGNVRETGESFRYQQRPEGDFEEGSFKTEVFLSEARAPQFVVVLGEVPAQGLVRTALAKLGRWAKGKLQFAVTRADLAAIVANFRKRPKEIVIDYDHATVYSAGSGEPVPASGWIKSVEDEPDKSGVLWGLVEWTEKARRMILGKEYKYLSPVIDWTARDNRTGEQQGATITSAGLTNQPILDMPGIALSDGWRETKEPERKKTMVKKVVLADRAACTARVVEEDGTERVLGIEGLAPEPKVFRLSDVKRAADGRFDFATIPNEGMVEAGVLLAHRAQELLDGAVKEGKILPAQRATFEKLALSDTAGFGELIAGMKPQLDLSQRGITGGGEGGDLAKVDAQIAQEVAKRCTANPKLGAAEAQRLVLSEQPALRKRREELMAE